MYLIKQIVNQKLFFYFLFSSSYFIVYSNIFSKEYWTKSYSCSQTFIITFSHSLAKTFETSMISWLRFTNWQWLNLQPTVSIYRSGSFIYHNNWRYICISIYRQLSYPVRFLNIFDLSVHEDNHDIIYEITVSFFMEHCTTNIIIFIRLYNITGMYIFSNNIVISE